MYYTTGTVATCILHPSKGKTQLFRRNMTADDLDLILQNPRTHTGVGYYTKAALKRDADGNTTSECDDALRWRYVQAVTGFCSSQQVTQIAAFCKLWNSLRFAPGPTNRQKFEALYPELVSRCKCGRCDQDRAGSTCSLATVLWKVVDKTETENMILPALFPDSGREVPILEKKGFFPCACDAGKEYTSLYGKELLRLERQLMAFPKDVRRELVYFFFKNVFHSHLLMVSWRKKFETFGAQYLSTTIQHAHWAYGEMMYDHDDEFHPCFCHGV